MTKSTPKITVWLVISGYSHDATRDNPIRRYRVTKIQNAIRPEVGAWMEDSDVEKLIADGITVNIS